MNNHSPVSIEALKAMLIAFINAQWEREPLEALLASMMNITAGQYVIRITNPGPKKINFIKMLRVVLKCGLKEAKDASEGVPLVLNEEQYILLTNIMNASGTQQFEVIYPVPQVPF